MSKIGKILILIWAISLILWGLSGSISQDYLPENQVGTAGMITDYARIDDKIAQIVHDESFIYLLFDRDGENVYIQAFDLIGTYKYTLSIDTDGSKGHASMALKDGLLYVCDYQDSVYVFRNGHQQAYYLQTVAPNLAGDLDFSTDSGRFRVQWGSVWRMDISEPVCVIQRSFRAFVNQYSITWIISFISMLLVVFFEVRHRKSKMVE